jgi:hypothetical protein
MVLVVSVACAGACGDNGPSGPPPVLVSGTRLRATWLADADGNRLLPPGAHWTDQDLAMPCNTDSADDGELRCLPHSGFVSTSVEGFFADAACTIRAQETVPTTCGADTDPSDDSFATTSAPDPDACAGGKRGRIAATFAPGAPLFARDGDGNCVAGEVPDHAISIGADVEASTFAHVHEEHQAPGGARLAMTVRLSDDGASEPVGIFDSELAAPCVPSVFGDDGALRCVPSIGQAVLFSDDACLHPVVEKTPPSCSRPDPALVQWTTPAGDPGLARIGAELATPPAALFFESGLENPVCMPLAGGDPGKTYLDTAPAAATDLAALHDVEVGTGRIVEHGLADDDGNVVARLVSLHDTVLDADVTVFRDGDMHTLLLPPFANGIGFSDADCTDAIAIGDGSTTPVVAVSSDPADASTCSVRQIFSLAGPAEAGHVFLLTASGCIDDGPPAGPVFAVGDELPVETFVELHLEVD